MGSVLTPDPDPDRGGRGSGSAENRGGGACPGFSVRPSTLFLEALAARCPQLFRPPNRAVPTARRSAVTHAPPIAAGGPPARPSRVLRFLRASHARFGLDLMASAGAGAPWAEVTRPLVAASSHTRRTAWGRSASLRPGGRPHGPVECCGFSGRLTPGSGSHLWSLPRPTRGEQLGAGICLPGNVRTIGAPCIRAVRARAAP